MNHPSPATTSTARRRLQCLPLAGVVAAACVLTPNGQLAIQTHAAPISAPRLDTRAVQFAAFVQEMTTREQELCDQLTAAAATNTFAGPVPLAATDPLATAGGVVVDAIRALGVAVVEAAKSTAVSVVSIPLIMLNRAATDPFYLPWLPIGLVAYAFTLPFQVVGTFAYDLVANLTKVVTALVPAAAGPAPAAADSPASVAANPSPTAANPVQQAIDTVKTRVTDATNAAGSALAAAPSALASGLQLPSALAPLAPIAGAAYAALSPAIAVANFISVLVTGKALPFNVVKPQLSSVLSVAATAPRATAATDKSSEPDSPATGNAGTNDAAGAEKPSTQTEKKSTKTVSMPRTRRTSPTPTASTTPAKTTDATDDSPTKTDSDPAPAGKPEKPAKSDKPEKSEKPGTDNSSAPQHDSTKGKKASDKKAKDKKAAKGGASSAASKASSAKD
ncbi:hypothetical protein [Mycolicibacterium mucogenicum]|uniref:Uncharacterized protein n=1 Tax=Mycolicibacterium mucogenicum TaxID=56689 RepID=A0A4R5WDN9_MYCMU|nr:hypothetical protein [Mycolicibacterium mucogenicum]TDK87889.1 hypothetical protein EUA03_16230 [Mycolicibacterium mucogenicum]